ncbi:MAG: radical SAM family heme chaperone HemW [Chitinophagaceae bacterium]
MAGIYIHIPFCRKACHYCNFHFSTTHSLLPKMLQAITKEMVLRKNETIEIIETIYLGGGTPSLCSVEELQNLLQEIKTNYTVDANAEITIETNPDDISLIKLNNWKAIGINRLSIGIQSFFDEDLLWMNRAHNATQALNCIDMAQSVGLTNISIDLIYGTPTLSNEQWQKNVAIAIEKNIPHLSCYALTVEPKTALQKMIHQNKIAAIEVEKQAEQFELLMQWLENSGYEHYEISNFSKANYQSKHNSSYWQGKMYLGFGPSAHSFNKQTRQWNIANNALYIESIEKNIVPFEVEVLSTKDCLNEYIMTSLRTNIGIDTNTIKQQWGDAILDEILQKMQPYFKQKLALIQHENILLTKAGKLLADGIASDLFFID